MKAFGMVLVLSVTTAIAGPKSTGKAMTDEAEDEAMITQVENIGKSIQEAMSKIAGQMKAGGSSEKDTAAAKQNLEQLAKQLQKGQAAMKGGAAAGRTPGAADSSSSEMMKTLQGFIQSMTSKVIENANQSVDKLNKMSDENP